MDKAMVLRWEINPIALEWYAETKFVTYKAYADGLDDGHLADAAAAMDACEADYIARCSEFLRVAGPGECVVRVEDLKVVLDDYRAADLFDGDVADRLTAAIDAAGGGK